MNKQEIINKVKTLNLPKNSYIVFGSCPLAILGLREANDIDLLVSSKIHKSLEQNGWKKINKGPKDTPLTYDVFEAHNNWNFSSYNPTLEDLLTRAIKVDDIPFASVEDVRKWKQGYGRPRDIADIKLIDDYFKRKSVSS